MTATNANSQTRVDFAGINSAALFVLPVVLDRWLPGGRARGHEYVVRNPRRLDKNPGSFSISLRTGRWSDFATGDRGGDPISLAAYLFGITQYEAARKVAQMLGIAGGRNG